MPPSGFAENLGLTDSGQRQMFNYRPEPQRSRPAPASETIQGRLAATQHDDSEMKYPYAARFVPPQRTKLPDNAASLEKPLTAAALTSLGGGALPQMSASPAESVARIQSTVDWDDEFDDLVQRNARPRHELEYCFDPQAEADYAEAMKGVDGSVIRWVAPALVAVGIVAGVSFPEKFGIGNQPVQTAAFFVGVPAQPEPVSTASTLRAYNDAQERNFTAGLKRMSNADLLSYAAVAQTDRDRAGSVIAPYMEDALTLTQNEIARRNLVAPTRARIVDEVLIPAPL